MALDTACVEGADAKGAAIAQALPIPNLSKTEVKQEHAQHNGSLQLSQIERAESSLEAAAGAASDVEDEDTMLKESAEESDQSDADDNSGDDQEYKEDVSSSEDESDENVPEDSTKSEDKSSPSQDAKAPKIPRKRPAKTAREFWIRWQAENNESAFGGEKRKRSADDTSTKKKSNKSTKTCPTADNASGNGQGQTLVCMAPIVADSQASQFAQIKAQMAQGADTRRKSTQKADLERAVKSFGYKKVLAVNGNWRLKSMITPLKNFQITVTSWMCQREVCFEPAGGVLADDMGTGKTLMTLGLISSHTPEEQDRERFGSATLVIVPNAGVADQWRKEIRQHCGPDISRWAMTYDSKVEPSREELQEKTIVITTFSEIGRQYPSKDVVKNINERYKDDPIAVEEAIEDLMGVLFQTSWYRVVLDEAQNIKGRITQCSLATATLDAKYRWCLSGTPLSNDPEEYYPYLRFIRFPYTMDKSSFNEKFTAGEDHLANFESMASWVIVRRNKTDSFLGHKLFELPDKIKEDIYVPLSVEEQIISECLMRHYERCNAEAQSPVEDTREGEKNEPAEKIVKKKGVHLPDIEEEETPTDGPLPKRISVGITLAAAVSHPFNLERIMRSSFTAEEVKELRSELLAKGGRQPVISQIVQSPECSPSFHKFQTGIAQLNSYKSEAFGGLLKMDGILDCVLGEVRDRDATCPGCGATPNIPTTGPYCGHVYCQSCMMGELYKSLATSEQCVCVALDCGARLFVHGTPFTPACRPPTISQAIDNARSRGRDEPGRDGHGVRIGLKPERNGFFTVATQNHQDILPSAKLTAALTIILQWQTEHPDDKIIVFTQYIMTAKCLGWMLEKAGIGFLYYNGDVSEAKKRKAIAAFRMEPDKKVMVVSLRAGGTALNLVVANRVILIDPWWNDEAEKQAFGRVERIGQQKKMHMVKIWTKSVADKNIEEMQIDKKVKVAYALQDDGHTPVQLSDESLAKVFSHRETPRPRPGSKLAAKNAEAIASNKDQKRRGEKVAKPAVKPKSAPKKRIKSAKTIKKET